MDGWGAAGGMRRGQAPGYTDIGTPFLHCLAGVYVEWNGEWCRFMEGGKERTAGAGRGLGTTPALRATGLLNRRTAHCRSHCLFRKLPSPCPFPPQAGAGLRNPSTAFAPYCASLVRCSAVPLRSTASGSLRSPSGGEFVRRRYLQSSVSLRSPAPFKRSLHSPPSEGWRVAPGWSIALEKKILHAVRDDSGRKALSKLALAPHPPHQDKPQTSPGTYREHLFCYFTIICPSWEGLDSKNCESLSQH